MALTDTLKSSQVEVNDFHASDVKENLKQFLETHDAMKTTKEALQPLFTDVVSDETIADKIETTVNKEHIQKLLATTPSV